MEIFDRAPRFTFRTKTLAEEFLKRMRRATYMFDVVTINDILKDRGESSIPGGFDFGYHRNEVRKLKPKSVENHWSVEFPIPSRMVRDKNGYWKTENVLALEKSKEGG